MLFLTTLSLLLVSFRSFGLFSFLFSFQLVVSLVSRFGVPWNRFFSFSLAYLLMFYFISSVSESIVKARKFLPGKNKGEGVMTSRAIGKNERAHPESFVRSALLPANYHSNTLEAMPYILSLNCGCTYQLCSFCSCSKETENTTRKLAHVLAFPSATSVLPQSQTLPRLLPLLPSPSRRNILSLQRWSQRQEGRPQNRLGGGGREGGRRNQDRERAGGGEM